MQEVVRPLTSTDTWIIGPMDNGNGCEVDA